MKASKGGQDRTPTGHRPDGRKRPKTDAPRRTGEDAHTEAARLLAEGLPVAEVARRLGVRRQTVSGWKNHHAKEALATERAKRAATFDDALTRARTLLRDNTEAAAKVLVAQLEDEDPAVAQAAAKTLLDRAGLPRVEVVQKETSPLDLSGLSADELEIFERLLAKAGG